MEEHEQTENTPAGPCNVPSTDEGAAAAGAAHLLVL